MFFRPLERSDIPAFETLSLPLTCSQLGLAGPSIDWEARLKVPSGDAIHRFGAWEGGRLRGFYEIQPGARARTRHAGSLLMTGDCIPELLAHALDFSDRWLGLGRLETQVETLDQEALLRACGFQQEVHKIGERRTAEGLRDLWVFGRLRPGWQPEPPRAPPEWPPKGAAVTVQIRPGTVEDAAAMASTLREEAVVWGTLQLPSVSGDLWTERLSKPWGKMFMATVDEKVVGNAGIHPLAAPSAHVAMMGMSIRTAFQGRGVAGRLMEALIAEAAALGMEKIGLEVYEDNPRAVRLYQRFGFVGEGRKRCDVWRDGGFAHSLVMARRMA